MLVGFQNKGEVEETGKAASKATAFPFVRSGCSSAEPDYPKDTMRRRRNKCRPLLGRIPPTEETTHYDSEHDTKEDG